MPAQSSSASLWLTLAAAIALVWLGMVVGVSFIATPVKFAAASLTRPVAFDVGGVTFALFSRIEWGVCALLAITLLIARPRRIALAMLALLIAIILLQCLWLLPELNLRAAAVIAGKPLPPSIHHGVFAAIELLKVLLLAALAAGNLWHLSNSKSAAVR